MKSAPSIVSWAVAGRPCAGHAESGDLHLVTTLQDSVLVAVVDGLGHGEEAAAAARIATATLEENVHEPIETLIGKCHEALIQTRGVVMSLALISAQNDTMTWLGVGNVEGALLSATPDSNKPAHCILLRGGVVGYQLPPLRPVVIPIAAGDILVFATDGIDYGFKDAIIMSDTPQRNADRILARYGKDSDDALVLVLRWNGRIPA